MSSVSKEGACVINSSPLLTSQDGESECTSARPVLQCSSPRQGSESVYFLMTLVYPISTCQVSFVCVALFTVHIVS